MIHLQHQHGAGGWDWVDPDWARPLVDATRHCLDLINTVPSSSSTESHCVPYGQCRHLFAPSTLAPTPVASGWGDDPFVPCDVHAQPCSHLFACFTQALAAETAHDDTSDIDMFVARTTGSARPYRNKPSLASVTVPVVTTVGIESLPPYDVEIRQSHERRKVACCDIETDFLGTAIAGAICHHDMVFQAIVYAKNADKAAIAGAKMANELWSIEPKKKCIVSTTEHKIGGDTGLDRKRRDFIGVDVDPNGSEPLGGMDGMDEEEEMTNSTSAPEPTHSEPNWSVTCKDPKKVNSEMCKKYKEGLVEENEWGMYLTIFVSTGVLGGVLLCTIGIVAAVFVTKKRNRQSNTDLEVYDRKSAKRTKSHSDDKDFEMSLVTASQETPWWFIDCKEAMERNDIISLSTILDELQPGELSTVDAASGSTLLHIAVVQFSLDLVELVLAKNTSEINRGDRRGQTPLMLACMGSDSTIVESLLAAGANQTITNDEGETCLMTAIKYSCKGAAQALLEPLLTMEVSNLGTRTKYKSRQIAIATDATERTVVHWFASTNGDGDMGVLRSLFQLGASSSFIDAREVKEGWTALMIAAKEGNAEAVDVLIQNGASVSLRSNAGFRAVELAVDPKVIAVLDPPSNRTPPESLSPPNAQPEAVVTPTMEKTVHYDVSWGSDEDGAASSLSPDTVASSSLSPDTVASSSLSPDGVMLQAEAASPLSESSGTEAMSVGQAGSPAIGYGEVRGGESPRSRRSSTDPDVVQEDD